MSASTNRDINVNKNNRSHNTTYKNKIQSNISTRFATQKKQSDDDNSNESNVISNSSYDI